MPALLFLLSSVCVLSQEVPLAIIFKEINSIERAFSTTHEFARYSVSLDFDFGVNSLNTCTYIKYTQLVSL